MVFNIICRICGFVGEGYLHWPAACPSCGAEFLAQSVADKGTEPLEEAKHRIRGILSRGGKVDFQDGRIVEGSQGGE